MSKFDVERWLATKKEAGLKIDPVTAEVDWEYGQVMDPYGVYSDLPEECQQVGRQYFARSPGSDIWVHFRDLSDETRHALREKHKSQLAFPAVLEDGRKAARIIRRELQNLTGYDFTQVAPDLESEQARLEAAPHPQVLKCLHEFIAASGLSDSLLRRTPRERCKAAEPH
jgi:hypothetical protein